MAKPQLENGRTEIANELVDALAKLNLSAYEGRLLWAIFRKTYGWHKKADTISFTQFEKITGLDRRHVGRGLSRLIARNIIIKSTDGRINEYSIQKDYEQWLPIANLGNTIEPDKITETDVVLASKPDITDLIDYTGRICSICGLRGRFWLKPNDEEYCLQEHHTGWHKDEKTNLPVSDKTSATILVCPKCHYKIHNEGLVLPRLAIDVSHEVLPKEALSVLPKEALSVLPKEATKLLPKEAHTKARKHSYKSTHTKARAILPDYIDEDLWNDFLTMRKIIKKPPTARAQELLLKDLEKFCATGDDVNEIIRRSIKNNWQGLFPLKEGSNVTSRDSHTKLPNEPVKNDGYTIISNDNPRVALPVKNDGMDGYKEY